MSAKQIYQEITKAADEFARVSRGEGNQNGFLGLRKTLVRDSGFLKIDIGNKDYTQNTSFSLQVRNGPNKLECLCLTSDLSLV
jgi:hypothetical protein